MRTLLVIALAALGAYAAPLNTEVDLVQPRRVSTGGGGQSGLGYEPRPRISYRDLLRGLGLGGGAGFPGLFPSSNPNCDRGHFQLSDEEYSLVMDCQRSSDENSELKQCIVNALPDESKELKEFLNRDEYSLAGISSSFSIVILDGEIARKRRVTFRLCPDDEQNTVEVAAEPEEPSSGAGGVPFPAFDTTALFGGSGRPAFQLPDFFSQQNPFLDFGNAFKPFFQDTSDLFPTFPNFGGSEEGTNVDYENCVSESFELPREQFNKARDCQYGTVDFKQCLRTELGSSEEAKDLLKFVEADGHQIVGTRFYSYVSVIDGETTRKNKIRLQRCLKTAEPETSQPDEAAAAETEGADGEPAPAAPEPVTPVAPAQPDLTTPPNTDTAYTQGEIIEP
ncbi:uncharacterized protein LOC119112069 [Pollicipes pollicipes]|uniref:uncharacterized protein LOC119112069 n=1 Tax=Pollicipes pollicipes TaxID=41117 RepID=UPI001884E872|nr:uncharacterized protein LOC119112069 [Pollicipes pollicipes]